MRIPEDIQQITLERFILSSNDFQWIDILPEY